ncbi:MAG: amino acid racemase [Lachnospiraceae bacterium]|uniref:aspartate/glutamate racemase family protein n=1 Tax=uncultured Acetatifactor sp. TaxID=1671927 RepID=UPI0026313EC0|nr:amino acid racemase [uncultured Acetatifactor sp.]MCI8790107.1 amino acid racemase [Lachnospiraceae bacterium]
MKKLGVIGGLGPMATAYFLQLLVQMTEARTDQEHIEVLLHSKPQIPDRTRFILGQSREDPLPQMVEIGRELAGQGAELIAVPCVTAHYFQKKLEDSIGIPVVDTIRETALSLKAAGVTKAGILATDGTIESGLFQRAFAGEGISAMLPDRAGQQAVMQIIYQNVKAGQPVDSAAFWRVAEGLFGQGAQAVLLACTELSLVKRDFGLGEGFLDVMEVLARKAVLICGRLKGQYECLLRLREGQCPS